MYARINRFLFVITIGLMIALLLLVLPIPISSAPLAAQHWVVDVTTTADEYDVSSIGSGCSLREAIKTANDFADFGGCVHFTNLGASPVLVIIPSGTYTLTLTGSGEDFDATGDLDVRASMIISATGATLPIVTGDVGWDDRIFHILAGTVTSIKGMIIRGGSISARDGGAVMIEFGASLTLNDSTVSSNKATNGGDGGGISNEGGTAALTNVTLSGNSATFGGGILNSGTATLTNVTLSGNSATSGGGISNEGGTAALTNVTLSDNSATSGGGIWSSSTSVTVTLTMVILSGNSGGNCRGSITSSDANLSSDNTCGFIAGRSNVNVKLAPLGNYGGPTLTQIPLPGSPAIDNGDNLACPATDQRGKPRPVNTCDVGAVERQLVDYVLLYLPLIRK